MKHYSYSEKKAVAADQNIKERDYWLEQFSGEFTRAFFHYDYKKTGIDNIKKETIEFSFSEQLAASLMKLSKNSDHALHIILMAGLAVLLEKYTRLNDIVMGSPIYKQAEDGEFINTVLAIRLRVEAPMSFKDLLMATRDVLMKAIEHQNYPIETLIYKLNMEPDPGEFPLFDVALLLENIHDKRYLRHINPNVIFSFRHRDNTIEGLVEYNPDLYMKSTVHRIIKHFMHLLQELLRNPDGNLSTVSIISPGEKKQILFEFNDTGRHPDKDECFQQVFEAQANRTPGRTAAVHNDRHITYKELNTGANKVAALLREKGITRDKLAAVWCERSVEMLTGILGIFKAGGAYIPLEIDSPLQRMTTTLADSETVILLTTSAAVSHHPAFYRAISNDTQIRYIVYLDKQEIHNKEQESYLFRTFKLASLLIHETTGRRCQPQEKILYYDGQTMGIETYTAKVNQLGHFITALGINRVSPDTRWGVLLENPLYMIVILLAVKSFGIQVEIVPPQLEPGEKKKIITKSFISTIFSESKYLDELDQLFWETRGLENYIIVDDYHYKTSKKEQDLRKVWDVAAGESSDAINDYRWSSIYTGEPFSLEEMNQYITNFKAKLSPYLTAKTRVLEVGCGHGLVLFEIAPRVGYYYAADLTPVVIEKNKIRVRREGLTHVELKAMPASAIDTIATGDFDIFICSSVIHFFPNTVFLEEIIKNIIHLLKDQGIIYLDDVLDLRKKEEFNQSKALFRRTNPDAWARTEQDNDLYVDLEFFHYLQGKYPEIVQWESSKKLGTIQNELTRFRYDVLLKIDKRQKGVSPNPSCGGSGKKARYFSRDIGKYSDLPIHSRRPGENKALEVAAEVLTGSLIETYPGENLAPVNSPGDLSYMIYTSGTTGKPKGVMIHHLGMLNHLYAKVNDLSITAEDILAQTASAGFDISVWQFLAGLLRGACSFIIDRETVLSPGKLLQTLREGKITVWESVPSLMAAFLRVLENKSEKERKLAHLRWMIFTGEPLPVHLAREWCHYYPHIKVLNAYGPTEASDDITHYVLEKMPEEKQTGIPIGKPIRNTHIYILDRNLSLCPVGVRGEICVAGLGVGRGYWKDPDKTRGAFIPNPYVNEIKEPQYTLLYKTGDVGFSREDGNIECLGRIDHQVKIRGNRIELEEIEHQLLKHDEITAAVVMIRTASKQGETPGSLAGGEKYLCAYMVARRTLSTSELREYLSLNLPQYMVPSYFIQLEKIPLTVNGKINRDALKEPEMETGESYTAPRDKIESKLAEIWADVLGVSKDRIGIDANFFELGGHSLKATILTTLIHRGLGVNVPLLEIFKSGTIRQLSTYIKRVGKTEYQDILAVEKREYYGLSSAQQRLYFLQQMDLSSTSYNIPLMIPLEKSIEKEKLEFALKQLIIRHESLRTSFLMIGEDVVQRIHDRVEFDIQYVEVSNPLEVVEIFNNFIKPFDLSRAPLMRSGLIRLPQGNYIWVADIHHIISDGTSQTILAEDLLSFYNREELEPLRLQYKDFSQWQNRLFESGEIKAQLDYWLGVYWDAHEIPRLQLPTDFKRPGVFTFKGDQFLFAPDREDAVNLKTLGSQYGGTLYMNILAVLNVLFYKYTGQTDIIIGSGIAGRRHADLQGIVGMFVNTLPMRNAPHGDKTYELFLKEVINNSIQGFENQDLQFEELVDQLELERNPSRNPLFDITMVVQNFREIGEGRQKNKNNNGMNFLTLKDETLSSVEGDYRNPTSKFDLTFFVNEEGQGISILIEYYTGIFREETIRRLAFHFKQVIKTVIKEPSIPLKNIEIIAGEEKQQLLFSFNSNSRDYPQGQNITALFDRQFERAPDSVALIYNHCRLTYSQLARTAQGLACFLYYEKGIRPQDEERVGLIMDKGIESAAAVLGILKAGAGYVPIESSFPLARKKHIISDAHIGIVISEKKFIKELNRLQWECDCLVGFLCMDSDNIYEEKEVEANQLMNRDLWEHVGSSAVDEIAGGGWVSSYTGQTLSQREMDEYGDNILKKLSPLLHEKMRVLEIGCASGISMFRLAPKVGLYYGVDLSAVIIKKNKQRIEKEGHHNIKLACLAAHEIHTLDEKGFDLIIINSVIQCFHGHNYLRQVIRQCIDLMAARGRLFMGDIMDQELKSSLENEMTAFKSEHPDKNYTTKTDFSTELFISRGFWEDLRGEIKELAGVEFSPKIFTIANELTKFRYDALLSINKHFAANKIAIKKKYQFDGTMLKKSFKPGPVPMQPQPGSLAYIIYTSGTTGQPKGVMVEHRQVMNCLDWMQEIFALKKNDVVLQRTNLTFDPSVWEILWPLTIGAQVLLLDPDQRKDAGFLLDLIDVNAHFDIAVMYCPASLLTGMTYLLSTHANKRQLKLRWLIIGAEPIQMEVVKNFYSFFRGRIVNTYGPTECTINNTYYMLEPTDERSIVPIGKPVANNKIYILDSDMRMVPVHAAGNIYIGGAGTARGYIDRPLLTSEKFQVKRIFPGGRKEIIYQTGDIGRWLEDGHVEFLGREDQQVKVRGFRIELGEIESLLLNHRAVKRAVIVQQHGELCAYVILGAGFNGDRDIRELRSHLSHFLPDYMVPVHFIQVEKIPLTTSGKIDIKALPEPGYKPAAESDENAPRNRLERELVEIWRDVLARPDIGINDNFFEKGGHSLKATIVAAKIQKELDVHIPLAKIFQAPTIRALAVYIRGAAQDRYTAIQDVEQKEYYPLSSAQKRLYILQQMDPDSTAYNMPGIIPPEEELDIKRVELTFKKLIARHESLRTSFRMVGDEPVQIIHGEVEFKIENFATDLQGQTRALTEVLGGPNRRTLFQKGSWPPGAFIKHFIRPFDLSHVPLLRVGSVKGIDGSYMLWFDMHHIICDGISQTILEKEFMSLYRDETLSPLRLQYKNFSQWQNSVEQQKMLKQQEQYWKSIFSEELPVLNLSTDYPRPLKQNFAGNWVKFALDGKQTVTLKQVAVKNNITLYMSLLAIMNILLSRLSGQEIIIIGTPIAARRHDDLRQVIGMLVNTLAMKNYPGGDKPLAVFLKEVKQRTLEAYENQEYPFEMLVDIIGIPRDTSRNPIFDVMLNVLNQSQYEGNMAGFTEEGPYEHQEGTSKFDLNWTVFEVNEKILVEVEYASMLFKAQTVEKFIKYFQQVLNVLSSYEDNPAAIKLREIEIITDEEKDLILNVFNNTSGGFRLVETIHQWFDEQVEKMPDATALVHDEKRLTYRELNNRSDGLAVLLRSRGVEADVAVGLMVERSFEMLIGIFGILKAGGAYLPIDPGYPGQRKLYMIADSDIKLLLTNVELNGLNVVSSEIEMIDLRNKSLYMGNGNKPVYSSGASNLIYLIYTSGSTGKPKGVMLEHKNIVNLIYYDYRCTNLDFSKILQFHTLTFDASIHEISCALLWGGELYLVDNEIRTDIGQIFKVIARHKIKTLFLPMSFLKLIFSSADWINQFPTCVSHIQTAGEQVVVGEAFREYLKNNNIYLHNHYGPSETHVVTALTMDPQADIPQFPPIGKPLLNTVIYIVDKASNIMPIGVTGELIIGGIQVGRGYLNRPELTAEKFNQDLWDKKDGRDRYGALRANFHHSSFDIPPIHHSKLYRTGDLARWLQDGNVEFLGRIDYQVKIRGFRVELGEIESRLLKNPGIKDAIVLAREENKKEKYLCAYIVCEGEPVISKLREHLSKELPDYMIPSHFVRLGKIPLTSSGKVDRKALPVPGLNIGDKYSAPRNKIESKLVAIWNEILNWPSDSDVRIGIDDNFFQLGGHSLKATVLGSRIHKELNVKLPLVELFKTPTIRGLSEYIRGIEEDIYEAIMPVEKKEYYGLSFAQKRLYILQQIDLNSTAYNMPEIIPLAENVDFERLEESFKKLIKSHESLRTSFHMIGDQPAQKVHQEVEFKIEIFGRGDPAWSPEIITNFVRPFDLSHAPLLRVGLLKSGTEKHLLLVDMHHIISDGVSQEVLVKDFLALQEGKELPALRLQYKDFAHWQNSPNEIERLRQQMSFWLTEFAGEIPVLEIPTDYPRPISQSFVGNNIDFEISTEETRSLKNLALQGGATLFMVLAAAVNILLSKLSGQEEIIIGTPIAGRRHSDLEKIIGMFVNTLVLRSYPIGDRNFKEFQEETKRKVLTTFENQEYPFEELVDRVSVKRDMGRNPLFDVMFVLQNMDTGSPDGDEENLFKIHRPIQLDLSKEYENLGQAAKFDLTFTAVEIDEKTLFTIQYCTKLFKKETIERFINYFKKIVSIVVKKSNIRLSDIEIISEEEKKQILFDFNNTAADYPKDKTIHRLFVEQALKTPDHVSLVGADRGEEKKRRRKEEKRDGMHLSYYELNEQSDRLAGLLIERGVLPDIIVGLMMERSVEIIVGILGILKSGGAYLPIDPEYPQERIKYMLKDSGTKLLAVANVLEGEKVKSWEGELLVVTNELKGEKVRRWEGEKECPRRVLHHSNQLAYIIYTSGSTGKPKGVMVEHRNVVNLAISQKNRFAINEKERILQFSSICFDASVEQIFMALFSGAVLLLIDKNTLLDNIKFEELISSRLITHLHAVPSFLNNISLKEGYQLKRVISGGDVCPPGLARKYGAYCDFYNEYGPTETTVTSIEMQYADINEVLDHLPIGKPIANTLVYVFDKWLKPVPFGVAGELYIGGVGVSRGYLNRPELTAESFKRNIISSSSNFSNDQCLMINEYFYKTGDLVRWLPEGVVQFLGRIDCQVKIRGYRIELGEIENKLLKHEWVKTAVVILRGEKDLCAYVVPEVQAANEMEFRKELKVYLTGCLPSYMVPPFIVFIKNISMTPSGKVDLRALPQPEAVSIEEYIAPRNIEEAKLIKIWAEVLGNDAVKNRIGIDANFFELGGHSLKATILVSRIHKELKVKIPLAEFFKNPTIRGLSEYIGEKPEEIYESIMPVEEKEYYVLSFAQKRMYILQQIDPNSTAYNMPQIIPLAENADFERFEESFKKLIKRHESLRTSFHMIGDQPAQKVHDEVEFKIEIFGRGDPAWSPEIITNFTRPFDLSRTPLLRVGLVRSESEKHFLMVDMHHIISDGVSHEILVKDFLALHKGKLLPSLRLQYKDFAQWQNSPKEIERLQQQMSFWLNELAGEIPILEIPTDYPRPISQSFAGNSIDFEISVEETRSLKNAALQGRGTLFMVLTAAVNILLSKLSGQEEIIIGTPIAGRRHSDLEKIIGIFVNTLAIKNYPIGQRTFGDFLAEVKERMLKIFENQEYPFEELVDKLALKRDMGRNPLFDVMFVLQNINIESTDGDEENRSEIYRPIQLDFPQEYENIGQSAKFDLTFTATEIAQKLFFSIQYCTKLFKRDTIDRFIDYFKKIISGIVKEPDATLNEINILAEIEKKQLLFDFNNTETAYPKDKTLHQLFVEQVEKTPDSVGLVEDVGHVRPIGPVGITYRQLNEQSDRLAGLLNEKGVQPGNIVAIMMKRSIEMIIGIIGILKSGGAYLPIDPNYPKERIKYMLQDSKAEIIVNSEFLMDAPQAPFFHHSSFIVHRSNAAYVIYTSGSTGNPKGVPITHANFSPLLHWGYRNMRLLTGDRFLQNLSYFFDWSVWEIFLALTTGAGLYITDEEVLLDGRSLGKFINHNKISVLHITPSQFQVLVGIEIDEKPLKLESLRHLCLGAEKLTYDLLKRSLEMVPKDCRIYNMYGPTEATIIAAILEIDRDTIDEYRNLNSVPIGVPVGNTQLYVLDKYFKLCPLNVVGELYIGGDGVANGYLNNPELTTEKFIFSPNFLTSSLPNFPLYRTGDLARWLPGGVVEILGRIDFQVKIRGYRIELGEIENNLLEHKQVKAAVIIVRGESDLYAYIVPAEPLADEIQLNKELKEYLNGRLPGYMVPTFIVLMKSIPLTPNGKVDLHALRILPDPEIITMEEYTAPRDEVEEKLVHIWSEILGSDKGLISVTADFFELGGHSLKATLLASRIHKEFDIVLPLGEIFKAPTIRALGKYIKNTKSNIHKNIDWNLVLIKEGLIDNNHLFFIHAGSGEVEGYFEFCKQLPINFNCWGIRADRLENLAPRNVTIRELAEKYIGSMKKVQHHGPYYIVGWSLGGTIAFEMAAQLEQMNEKIAFLALIDSPPPHKSLWAETCEFNFESELNLIREYSPASEWIEKTKSAADLNQLWSSLIDYLEASNYDVEIIKKMIAEYGVQALPNFQQLNIKEAIYYLNLVRTLRNARARYEPAGKIHTHVHYFAAGKSQSFKKEYWQQYAAGDMVFSKIEGDHFSILKMPIVTEFARKFAAILQCG